jgi:hypothetical protein
MANKKSNLKRTVTFSLTQVILFVLVFAAVGGYAVWKSLAAKSLPATLTATPNPVSPNGPFSLYGCGFAPNMGVAIKFVSPTAAGAFGGPADANGCYDSTKYGSETASNVAGVETISAYQYLRGYDHRPTLMASTVLTIQ